MAGKALVMMPWFPRDFMASTRHWHLYERALYRELLDTQWEIGSLPDDETRLARIVGLTLKEFAPLWKVIRGKFVPAEGGGLINERLEQHRVKALEQREKKARGAGIANAKRDAKRSAERVAQHDTISNAERDAKRSAERVAQHDTISNAERDAKSFASVTPPSPSPSKDTPVGGADAPPPVGTLKTEIYRMAKSLGIPGGVLTPELKHHGEETVWRALGATVKAQPADCLAYFRGILKPRERGFVC